MGRNRRGRNPSGIPGGVKSFVPWERGGPDRGPPEPRSSSDRRSPSPPGVKNFEPRQRGGPGPPKPRSSRDRRSLSPPRPHRRIRLPGKWFGFYPNFFQITPPPPPPPPPCRITTCPPRFSDLAPSLCVTY